jgi:glycoprotein 3-alpha-L-fucosyltransferase
VATDKKNIFFGEGCERGSDCELKAMRSHKFFLAFESRNCTDYITEKFWRSLDHDLIPVVIQPTKKFYERLAPPNSFIHASDFDFDAKKLAIYLEEVATDLKLYSSYLRWKRDYTPLYKGEDLEPLRMCELCYKLNNEAHEDKASSYTSISGWFNGQCHQN